VKMANGKVLLNPLLLPSNKLFSPLI